MKALKHLIAEQQRREALAHINDKPDARLLTYYCDYCEHNRIVLAYRAGQKFGQACLKHSAALLNDARRGGTEQVTFTLLGPYSSGE